MVWEDYFKCLSCDKQGKPEYLLRFLQGNSGIIIPRKEPQVFKNPWSSWLYESTISEVLRKAHKLLKDHPLQAQYWKSRGLPKKAIHKLRLGWLDGYNTIPIKSRKGKIIGGVARASDSTDGPKYVTPSRYHQDNSNLLYVPSYKRIDKADKVYLAFGLISAIAIYLAGYASCSPLTGKKVNPEILKDIRKPIIIVPDKLEEKEAMMLANRLGWRGTTKLLPYHDDILDPADMFLMEPEKLRGSLNGNRLE
jgi:DNA primase